MIALDLATGNNVWTSETLSAGTGAFSTGTPAVDPEGNYIGVTFNSGSISFGLIDTGHFAIFDTKVDPNNQGLIPVLFEGSDSTGVYSPAG